MITGSLFFQTHNNGNYYLRAMEIQLFRSYFESPVGLIEIIANNSGITKVSFVKKRSGRVRNNEHTNACALQLYEYFNKERKSFFLSLNMHGTDFQKKVWNALLKIPYGETISYLNFAILLGNRKAIRAVGRANGKNPIAIIIPCHRVIGSDGNLIGYSSGLDKKRFLLEHEGVWVQQRLFA